MIKNLAIILAALFITSSDVFALENIIRPFGSVRSAGMGGVKFTTGLYDENFFGNPARVMANPEWRVQILDLTAESTITTIENISTILKAGTDLLKELGGVAGKNSHFRLQTILPGVYIPHENKKMSYAFGFITNTQIDLDMRKNFSIDPQSVSDIGPAFTVGRKFMGNDELSVGITTHLTYRLSTPKTVSLVDLIQGLNLGSIKTGGEGTHIDFDIGGQYALPWKPLEWDLEAGAAINNIFDGRYSNIGLRPIGLTDRPLQQPRTLGFGVAARKPELWKFVNTVLALEFSDIGNNPSGSLFRTLHLGGETHYGVLGIRLGINQGYFSAGLGLDLKHFELDLATYGEEMTLNVGGLTDRRFALKLVFQI